MRQKNRKDYNHGKGGLVSGNARYSRKANGNKNKKNRTMGRNR